MKLKITLVFMAVVLMSTSTFATHIMGGQITAKQVSGLQYEVTFVAYRDISGSPMPFFAKPEYKNNNFSSSTILNVPLFGTVSLLNGVEEYTYIDTFSFPSNGSYTIQWEDCCRNGSIVNMANPWSESLYLSTVVAVDSASSNSTPVFLNAPETLAQLNNLYSYNPLPFDADGDSLAWSLVTPLSGSAAPVAGYVLPHADTIQLFSLNAATGEISWMPDMMGNFVFSFLVEEFRGGVKIGEIRRDMRILVNNNTANSARATFNTAGWGTNTSGNFTFNLPSASPFNLTVVATDGNNDLLTMNANGAPFTLASNPAYFSTVSGLGIASCAISWTPSAGQIKNAAYNIAFRVFEHSGVNTYVSDKSVQFKVTAPLSVKEIGQGIHANEVYPNPSNGSFYVPFSLDKAAQVKVEVLDSNGKLVSVLANKNMNAGQNVVLNTNSNFKKGVYSISITVDGKRAATKKLVITE